jgi:hypothetical protein
MIELLHNAVRILLIVSLSIFGLLYLFYRILLLLNHGITEQNIAFYLLSVPKSNDPSKSGFESFIGSAIYSIKDTIKCKNGEMELCYRVPYTLCDESGRVSLGAILALGDSLTSILSVACDKTHRPGMQDSFYFLYLL